MAIQVIHKGELTFLGTWEWIHLEFWHVWPGLQNEKVLLTVVPVQWILSKLLQALSVNGKIACWKWTVTRLHRLCPGGKKKNYRSYWHICQYIFGFSCFWFNPWHLNLISDCQVMVKYQKNTENIHSVSTSVKRYLTHAHASVPKVNFTYRRST